MEKENEILEYKKSLALMKEGIISLSAMLNKHNKGELYFGITNEGRPIELNIGKKTLADVTNEIRAYLRPLPNVVEVKEAEIEGTKVVKVYVEGDDTPYSAYGRYYIRIDDADIVMTNMQLEKYFDNKKDTYSKWENISTRYTEENIDEDLLIDTIRNANEKGRLNYVYRNAKEALTKLGLLDDNGMVKMAGYYLFGRNKPLKIKLGSYPTDNRTEFGEIKEFNGNIFECINEAILYIQSHISYKSEIIGIQRIDTPEIPIKAIREIVINSFAHAKYSMEGDYNHYVIYKSTIRIYNPGPIYKDINPIKFASSEIGSKIRNPLIASVLYKCGYIDEFGTGFDRTFTLCAQNNIGYKYNNDDFGFTFIFERDVNFLNNTRIDKIDDKKNDKISDKINNTDNGIVFEMQKNKYITIPELSFILMKSTPTIHRHIDAMVSEGKLKRVGSRKTGYWDVIDKKND